MALPWPEPGPPGVDILFGVRLHRYGRDAHAGRNTARLALATELPASVLADLTGISISTILADTPIATGVGMADADIRRFGQRVARRFGRFPFPDEVVPWLTPLTDVAREVRQGDRRGACA